MKTDLKSLLPPSATTATTVRAPSRYAHVVALLTVIAAPFLAILAILTLSGLKRITWAVFDAIASWGPIDAAVQETASRPPSLFDTYPLLQTIVAVLMVLAALAPIFVSWRRFLLTTYTLTDTHLYVQKRGLFEKHTVIPFGQITDFKVTRGPLGRLFSTVDIDLHSRGSKTTLHGVPSMLHLARHLEATIPLGHTTQHVAPRAVLWNGRIDKRGIIGTSMIYATLPALVALSPSIFNLFGGSHALGIDELFLATILAGVSLWKIWTLLNSRYELNTGAVIVRSGIIGQRETRVDLTRVADLSVRRPPLTNMLGCGHLVLTSESGEKVELNGLRDPDAIKMQIEHARAALRSVPA